MTPITNPIPSGPQFSSGPFLSYRIEDAARALGIGRTLIYRLIRDGQINVVKIGNRTVITTSELEAFLERGGAK